MGWFSRRKKEIEEASKDTLEIEFKIPHEHTWKDMPWYMTIMYDGERKTASYSIIEPYICIKCGEREDKLLEKNTWQNISPEAREEEYKKVQKRYKDYLKPRAVVEDMINNILMVKDVKHLEMMEKMQGLPHSGCGSSSNMKDNETEFRIKLPKEGEKK